MQFNPESMWNLESMCKINKKKKKLSSWKSACKTTIKQLIALMKRFCVKNNLKIMKKKNLHFI